MPFWTYQVDPTNFVMEGMLAVVGEHGNEIFLQPRNGVRTITVDDLLYLCENARRRNPGVLGQARVLTMPADFEMPAWQQKFWIGKDSDWNDLPRVKMYVTRVFDRRITRQELQENRILKSHPFAVGYQGTMRVMDTEQAAELDRLAMGQAKKD